VTSKKVRGKPSYIYLTTAATTTFNITTVDAKFEKKMNFNSSIRIEYPMTNASSSSNFVPIRTRSAESMTVTIGDDQGMTSLIDTKKLSTSYIVSIPFLSLITHVGLI
jgi:hypothetical protein